MDDSEGEDWGFDGRCFHLRESAPRHSWAPARLRVSVKLHAKKIYAIFRLFLI